MFSLGHWECIMTTSDDAMILCEEGQNIVIIGFLSKIFLTLKKKNYNKNPSLLKKYVYYLESPNIREMQIYFKNTIIICVFTNYVFKYINKCSL